MKHSSTGAVPSRGKVLKGGSARKGISFSAAAGISSLIAGLLLLPVIVSTIGSDKYGLWLFLLAIASILLYSDLGMGTAIVHFLSRIRGGDKALSRDAVVSSSYMWSFSAALIASAVFWLCGSLYLSGDSAMGMADSNERIILLCAGLIITMSMVVRPFGSILTGSGLLHVERQTQILAVLFRVVGTLYVCKFMPSIVAIAYVEAMALALPYLVACVVVFLRRLIVIRPSMISLSVVWKMLRYSVGAFGVAVTGAGIQQIGTVIVGLLGDANAVTSFNAAMRISGSARQVMTWVTEPFRSVLSRLYAGKTGNSLAVLRDFSLAILFAATITVFSLIIAGPQLSVLWLGESMDAIRIADTASLLLLALLLNSIHLPLIPAVDAAGRSGAFFVQQLTWLVFYVVLSCMLFPFTGIIGIGLAMLLPLPLIELWYFYKAKRILLIIPTTWFRGVILPSIPGALFGCSMIIVSRLLNPSVFLALSLSGMFVIISLTSLIVTHDRLWSFSSLRESLKSSS